MKAITLKITVKLMLVCAMGAPCAYAQSSATELFLEHVAKANQYIEEEYKYHIAMLDVLTIEDVKKVNNETRRMIKRPSPTPDMARLKENRDKLENIKPKCRNLPVGIDQAQHVVNYFVLYTGDYNIPAEDEQIAATAYAQYLINVLDKTQSLREKASTKGLNKWIRNILVDGIPDRAYNASSDHYLDMDKSSMPCPAINLLNKYTASYERYGMLSNIPMLKALKSWSEFFAAANFMTCGTSDESKSVKEDIKNYEKLLANAIEAKHEVDTQKDTDISAKPTEQEKPAEKKKPILDLLRNLPKID